MPGGSGAGRVRRVGVWTVVVVSVVVFAAVLAVSGLVTASVGNDELVREPGPSAGVPAEVSRGGVVVDGRRTPVASIALPPRTIALTFDDGPDPTWTPQVLAVLARHRVPGTFFVVGSMASRHPELLRSIRTAGSELGVHTFTHPDLAEVGDRRFHSELGETQLAVVGATGETTYLMRPPFSSTPDALDDRAFSSVVDAGRDGYVTVLTDLDTDDWQRPGVDAIVSRATPRDGRGASVLLHDAGGDRSQTVAALDRLIPALQAEGYRFTTVTDAVGLPPTHAAASPRDRWTGRGLLAVVGLATGAVSWLQVGLVGVGLVVVARLLLTLVVARRHARRRRAPGFRWGPAGSRLPEGVAEPVSVIVPAYNETENIEATLRSILANDHPLEILVVDDGSSDGTAELVERLALPGVRVLRQPNSGKSAALNTGIARARHDLLIMMDGDTVFQPDTVAALVAPFADPGVGAVAGNVKVADREKLIPRLQHIEYVVGFSIDRRVQDTLTTISTIPGAAGAFRRAAVVEVGGLSGDTLAEDTDLTIALGRAGWRVVYADRAVAWTEAPVAARQLWRQRYRWTYGTMQAIWKHRRAMRESGASGRMGRVGLAQLAVFQVLFPLAAPLVDVFFVYGLLFGDPATTLLLWGSMLAIQTLGAVVAFRLDGEPLGPLWVAPVQQLMYRQLMYAVLVRSVISALSGAAVRWQRIQRLGALRGLVPDALPAGSVATATGAAVTGTGVLVVSDGRSTPRGDGVSGVSGASGVSGGSAGDAAPAGPPERVRWLDALRALALVRVVTYHVLGWGWLSIVFPSMGVMFALGGSLMVQSLRRSETVDVVGRRLRRLLPPFWLFGLIVVPAMLWHGWSATPGPDGDELSWSQLLFWVFPVFDPPGSEWGLDATVVLWYVRAYLWFVLLTPVMLWLFRRRPLVAVALPLAVVAGDALLGGVLADAGPAGAVVLDVSVFAACWMVGFAHRDGTLHRVRAGVLLPAALLVLAAGGGWTATHPAAVGGYDLNEIPLGQALVSLGAVLLVLRASPRLAWIDRVPLLGRFIALVNARAVSIYLWHNVAIALAVPVDDLLGLTSTGAQLATAVVLTAVATLTFGWAEDLAAGRPMALLPGPARPTRAARHVRVPVAPAPPRIEAPPRTRESSLPALNAARAALAPPRRPPGVRDGAPRTVDVRQGASSIARPAGPGPRAEAGPGAGTPRPPGPGGPVRPGVAVRPAAPARVRTGVAAGAGPAAVTAVLVPAAPGGAAPDGRGGGAMRLSFGDGRGTGPSSPQARGAVAPRAPGPAAPGRAGSGLSFGRDRSVADVPLPEPPRTPAPRHRLPEPDDGRGS